MCVEIKAWLTRGNIPGLEWQGWCEDFGGTVAVAMCHLKGMLPQKLVRRKNPRLRQP